MTNVPFRPSRFGYHGPGVLAREANRVGLVLVDDEGETRELTHAQLDATVERAREEIAMALDGARRRVVVVLRNDLACARTLLGLLRAGHVPVLISHRAELAVFERVVRQTGATAAIVLDGPDGAHFDDALAREFPSVGRLPSGSRVGCTARAAPPIDPDELYVLLTSGSTGWPKCVVIGRRGQEWFQEVEPSISPYQGRADARVALVSAPIHHNSGLLRLLALLRRGGTCVLCSRFDPKQFLTRIERHRVTHAAGTPTMFQKVIDSCPDRSGDLSSLIYLRVGGGPCSVETLTRFETYFGCTIVQVYGLTEGGPLPFGWSEGPAPPRGSVGRPLPGVEAQLVPVDGGPALDGGTSGPAEGELWLRNPGVALGYLGADESDRRFRGDGWLATGDLLRRDEHGHYWYLGRSDDMFQCGGENIHPAEVERILDSHADVVASVVVPVPDPIRGRVPAAALVLREGRALTSGELAAYFGARGPAYMYPRHVFAVPELPLNSNLKPDRPRIARWIEQRVAGGAAERAAP